MTRRYSMPEQGGWTKLRPRSDREWHRIRVLIGYVTVIAIFIVASFVFRHEHRKEMEHAWRSAAATIEEVRPKAVTAVESEGGGGMLYEVAILVKYTSDGVDQERWITVQQQLETLEDAQMQAFRWKGKECIVRWKSSDPGKVFAEVS